MSPIKAHGGHVGWLHDGPSQLTLAKTQGLHFVRSQELSQLALSTTLRTHIAIKRTVLLGPKPGAMLQQDLLSDGQGLHFRWSQKGPQLILSVRARTYISLNRNVLFMAKPGAASTRGARRALDAALVLRRTTGSRLAYLLRRRDGIRRVHPW